MPMFGITSTLMGLNTAKDAGIRERASTLQNSLDLAVQKKLGTKQLSNAETDWSNFKRDFGDLESKMAKRADTGITGDVAGAAGKANADTAQAVAAGRGNLGSMIARNGVNPNSGRAVMATAGLNNQGAAVAGKAINAAGTGEENRVADVNNAQRLQFVSLGKGLPTEANANLNAAHGITQANANQNAGLANYYGAQKNSAYGDIGRGLGNLPWGSIGKGISSMFGGSTTNSSFQGNGPLQSYTNTSGSPATTDTSGNYGADWAGYTDYKHGGRVKKPAQYAEGGVILGPGTGTSDSIPAVIDGEVAARVSNKEYRIPAAVVAKIGKVHLDKLVAAFHGRQTWDS
jgi:hypothetical protein